MNRDKWLGALLLASWTLNVALVVHIFMKPIVPPGAYVHTPGHIAPHPGSHPPGDMPFGPEVMGQFRREMEPLHEQRMEYMRGLRSLFVADELDTSSIAAYKDSLSRLEDQIQTNMIEQLTRMHSVMTPIQRQKLSRRIMRGIGSDHDWKRDFQRGNRYGRSQRDSIRHVETH